MSMRNAETGKKEVRDSGIRWIRTDQPAFVAYWMDIKKRAPRAIPVK